MILARYFFLGLGLSLAGTATSIVSYFLAHLVPLTALGIAVVIVGITAATLPEQVTGSYAMRVLLRGSTLGIDSLLEEILARRQQTFANTNSQINSSSASKQYYLQDLEREEETISSDHENNSRAIYLPPGFEKDTTSGDDVNQDQRASVYMPLGDRIPTTLDEMRAAPTTLLSENEVQDGIRIFTPGAYLGQVKEIRTADITIEEALEYVLVESAELCGSVRVSEIEDTVVIELDDVKVQSESESYRHLLGSLPTSLAAGVVAIIRAAPVVITNEDIEPTRTVARLSILEEE